MFHKSEEFIESMEFVEFRKRGSPTLETRNSINFIDSLYSAHVAQSVEHILGKDEVSGSIPLMGSSNNTLR